MELKTDDADRDEVEILAEEFVARRRRGEHPSIEEYADRCPERADEVRELFPAIAAMERWKPRATTRRAGPRPGDSLGDYRVIREIGRGGMGIVFEAEKLSLGSRVAIKILPDPAWDDDLPVRRFRREAEVVGRLDHHPHIVPVHDVGQQDGLNYYVMPLIRGVGLDRLIDGLRRHAGIPGWDDALSLARTLIETGIPKPVASTDLDRSVSYWDGVARLGEDVAGALQHAHDRGTLHRDIKPANLLIDGSGSVMVTDFGVASRHGGAGLTRTGDLVGTLRYMAPERFRGENDPRSDVYSLGLTLYELLTLRPAYQSDNQAELLRMLTEARPVPPRQVVPAIPRDLETVVLKAIHPGLDRRYQTAAALGEDLGRFRDGLAVKARRTGLPEGIRRWAAANRTGIAAMAGGWAVIATMVGSIFIYRSFHPPFPPPPPPPAVGEAAEILFEPSATGPSSSIKRSDRTEDAKMPRRPRPRGRPPRARPPD